MKIQFYILIFLFFVFALPCRAELVPAWRAEGELPTSVYGHSSVSLPDGNLLIAGGIDASGAASNVCAIYDCHSGQIQRVNSLSEARAYFCLVAVPTSGASVRIFAIGGYGGATGNYYALASIEYLDYSSANSLLQWKQGAPMNTARADARAAIVANSSIIVTGGYAQSTGTLRSGALLASCEGIQPASATVFGVPNMSAARAGHLTCTFRDENGGTSIMAAGGEDTPNTSTEIFTNGSWTMFANPPKAWRRFSSGFGGLYGTARMFGGKDYSGAEQSTCEWYDVKAGWKYSPSMNTNRAFAPVVHIASPTDTLMAYLVAGGETTTGPTAETEYYILPTASNPSGTWAKSQAMLRQASSHTLNILGTNLPMVAGGMAGSGNAINDFEIFQPIRANDAYFAPEEIGRISDSVVVTIRNEWLLPVTLSGFRIDKSAEFFFTGDTSKFTLAPGSSRRIFVRFVPNDVGFRSSHLIFNIGGMADSVLLSGTGIISKIVLQTKNLLFGNVYLGRDSLICFPAIKNNGTDTTYIDSVTVTSASDFRIISPHGRCILAPDSVISVCVQFRPSVRGQAFATANLNIGNRRFPCALGGNGVLKYIKSVSSATCDTVNLEPAKVFPALITLRNPSDSNVNVTGFTFAGANAGLFSIAEPVPFVVAPNAAKEVFVNFMPLSEGEYRTAVAVINDGAKDSLTTANICFVVRSRSISFLSGTVDLGAPCTGDTVRRVILIQNPSSYDTIRVDSVTLGVASQELAITSFRDTLLAPKALLPVSIVFASDLAGAKNFTVVCHTSFGDARNAIVANVLPALGIGFGNAEYKADLAEKWSATLVTTAAVPTKPVRRAQFRLGFDGSLIHFSGIGSANDCPLDMAQTRITDISRNEKLLDLYWQSDITPSSEILRIDFETLLGGTNSTGIILTKTAANEFCFANAGALFRVGESCSGRTKLVLQGDVMASVMADGAVVRSIVESKVALGSVRYELVNMLGQVVYSSAVTTLPQGSSHHEVDARGFGAGIYCYRIVKNGNALISVVLPIVY